MPPSEIRKEAREALKGNWGKAVCIVLAYMLITFLIGFVEGLVGEGTTLYYIIVIAFSIISIPLSFGLIISFMKLKRGEEVKTFGFLKDGLSRFGKSWGITWHTFLKLSIHIIIGIIIFLIIPLILSAVLLYTNTDPSLTPGLGMSGLLIVCIAPYPLAIWVLPKHLLYILAYYIAYDNPELSSKECVKKSEKLMKGNRGNFLLLQLSFIVWIILAVLLLYIGMLWLAPYIAIAEVCFYDRLVKPEVKKIDEEVTIEE